MENYLFGSARVRVLENGLIGKEKLERLLAAPGVERCADLLAEFGVDVKRDEQSGAFLREETLLGRLRAAYAEVGATSENAAFARLFRWQYDCNNIKAAIKCFKRGVDPDEMLFDFGNFDAKTVLSCVEKNDFEALGESFGSAAREATDTFAKTGNPQWVDLILDRACYAAMLSDARESGSDYVAELVRLKIDLTDLLTCVRLLRMKSGEAGKMMLRDALIDGGTLETAFFRKIYDEGEDALWAALSYSEFAAFVKEAGGSEATLSAIERAADNFWMTSVRRAKMIPYGIEPMVAYLAATEYEVRNLRIVLAGVEAGLSRKTIGERIRLSYV